MSKQEYNTVARLKITQPCPRQHFAAVIRYASQAHPDTRKTLYRWREVPRKAAA